MAEARETEIKFELDPDEAQAIRPRLEARFGPGIARALVSTYFDTPDGAVRRRGLTLRVRADDDRRIQTVKRGEGGGLFDRDEWETEVAGEGVDAKALRKLPLRVLRKGEMARLAPVFSTVIARTTWLVETPRCTLEIALDEGRVANGTQAQPIVELEVELKRGKAADLFAWLGTIEEVQGLRLGVLSKSERGARLAETEPPKAYKAEPVPLRRGQTTEAAFQAVMRGCVRQFRLNEALLVERRAREPLHQARVALRRLRSALSLFGAVVEDDALARLKPQLQAVSRVLGAARDLDVFLANNVLAHNALDQDGPGAPDAPGGAAYRAAMEARRREAYDRLLATLAGPPFRRLMLDLVAWIEAGPWLTDAAKKGRRTQPVMRFAAGVLEARRRKVRRKGRHLKALDPESRHRVRIATKKLRYAADFFAGLARGARGERRRSAFIDALEALQDQLGHLNDIQTGHALAFDFAAHPTAEGDVAAALFAAGRTSAVQEQDTDALLDAAERAHRAFAGAKRFWTG